MVSKAELLNGFYQVLALWRMVLPAMFIGCLCGNVLQATRIWRFAESVLHRMARFIRLSSSSGPYLAMCFLNRYAANTMLAGIIRHDGFPPKYLLAVFLAGWFPTVLTINISMTAAKLSLEHSLPLADSIILATGRLYQATIWTQDTDFKGLEDVKYIRKRK